MSSADEIKKLINAYSRTLDSGDLDGFAALFSAGEWIFENGSPLSGQEEVRSKLLNRVVIYPDGTPRTRHLSTNEDLSIDDAAGTATCRRYVTVREAQILIEQWRIHYNTVRPHSALGYRPPAPESIVPMDQRPTMH